MTISSFNDTNVYDEIKKLWSEKYIFSDGKGSDNVKWYGEVVAKKGHCNCPDYGMFVAYIAKKHGSKIAVADVGCEYITPMQQTYAGHILPAFYKAGRWYIVNYLGAAGPFGIFYTEGKDDDKTIDDFITEYCKGFLPDLAIHNGLNYDKCEIKIKVAHDAKCIETFNKFSNKAVMQQELLDYLMS